jgi:hypothetical protein
VLVLEALRRRQVLELVQERVALQRQLVEQERHLQEERHYQLVQPIKPIEMLMHRSRKQEQYS